MSVESWEVEVKFQVDDPRELLDQLARHQFVQQAVERHEDIYFRHPARDFKQTDEAFRLRRIDHQACLTYKGPRQPGQVKTREEIELSIDAAQLSQWLGLLNRLGFVPVRPVRKSRQVFRCQSPQRQEVLVVVDQVEQLGWFAEVETVVTDSTNLETAQAQVLQLGHSLGLSQIQPKSYLDQLLARDESA